MKRQPYPCATDYWRLDGKLWYVAATMKKPFREVAKGVSVASGHDDGWARLRDPHGRGPDQSKYDEIANEIEVAVTELQERGELVWTNYSKDPTVDSLDVFAVELQRLCDLAHAVSITGAGLSGERERFVRDSAGVLGESAKTARRAIAVVLSTIRQDRREKRDDARWMLNDELGIPNCNHIVPDPNCPECTKHAP